MYELVYAHAQLAMPQDKFSHDEVIIFGHHRDGRIRCFFLSYNIHRVQIGSNCPDRICPQMDYCLLVIIIGKLIGLIYLIIWSKS